jgi:hypothetical protein
MAFLWEIRKCSSPNTGDRNRWKEGENWQSSTLTSQIRKLKTDYSANISSGLKHTA